MHLATVSATFMVQAVAETPDEATRLVLDRAVIELDRLNARDRFGRPFTPSSVEDYFGVRVQSFDLGTAWVEDW